MWRNQMTAGFVGIAIAMVTTPFLEPYLPKDPAFYDWAKWGLIGVGLLVVGIAKLIRRDRQPPLDGRRR
jgi:hypothetical protein